MFQNKKALLLIGGALLFLILILSIFVFVVSKKAGPVNITYWGLWEPEAVYQTVIADYKRLHPNVNITYSKRSPIGYRDSLNRALGQNGAPDIFRVHNSWMPMMKDVLAPIPSDVYSASSFKTTFYPVAGDFYPYAIPLEIDTLGLFVNDDIFRSGGVDIPTIWDGDTGFMAIARKLTVRDGNGRIKTSGAAMGTASNVDHWQEIMGLMMLQTGTNLSRNVNSAAAADALRYYSAFAGSERIWDETLENSTLAFANGKVAMYFGPSWRYFDIKALNPNLNFHVVAVPQLVGGATINYASYWAEGVSAKSNNKTEAFAFLKFLSSKEQLEKLYAAESKVRGFGEPYSRTDMASMLSSDPSVAPFIAAAPTAKGWYLASFTNDGDTGVNTRIAKYFTDAINTTMRGADPKGALDTVASGIIQVLGK